MASVNSVAHLNQLMLSGTLPAALPNDDLDDELKEIEGLFISVVIDKAAEARRAEARLQGASILPSSEEIPLFLRAPPFLFGAGEKTAAGAALPIQKHQKKPPRVKKPLKAAPPLTKNTFLLDHQRTKRQELLRMRRTPIGQRAAENITPQEKAPIHDGKRRRHT